MLWVGVLPGVLAAADARASLLWGGSAGLWRVDQPTGQPSRTDVSLSMPSDAASDLAAQPNLIWGIGGSPGTNRLAAFDPLTGVLAADLVVNASETIRSLAIDPTTGTMYGASDASLFQIERTTGAATRLGSTGVDLTRALGFDNSGNLYGVSNSNEWNAVDKLTGAATQIAVLDLVRLEDFAARPEDGVLFGAAFTNDRTYRTVQIDPATGAVTALSAGVGRPASMAFTLPEPAATALLLAAVVSSGWVGRSRRKTE